MPDSLSKILSDQLSSAVKSVQENMDNKDYNASGEIKRSLLYVVKEDGNSIKGTISAFEGIKYAEKGQPPRPETQSLVEAIYKWMPYRGIGDGYSDIAKYSLAGYIANKISRLGTKLWRDKGSKGQSRDIYTSVFDKTVDNINEKIKDIVSEQINKGVIDVFQKA